MVTVTFELPEDVLSSVRKDPRAFHPRVAFGCRCEMVRNRAGFPKPSGRDFGFISQRIHRGTRPVQGPRIPVQYGRNSRGSESWMKVGTLKRQVHSLAAYRRRIRRRGK